LIKEETTVKKVYEAPEMKLLAVDAADVITASNWLEWDTTEE